MSIQLKIKSKHLALEPAIIRHEERKLRKQIDWYITKHQISIHGVDWFDVYKNHPDLSTLYVKHSNLVSHRTVNVREESRATYLARAYIKGMPYKTVEGNCNDKLPVKVMESLIRMVIRYGNVRYKNEIDRSERTFKVTKTAEEAAKEDILKWLEQ